MNLSFWLSLIICNVIRLLTFFFSCNDLVVGFDLILCSCWFSREVGFPEFSEAGLARAASLPPRSSLLCSVHAGCTGEATCRPWSPGPVPTPVFSCPLSPFLCYPCLTQVLIPVSVVSPVWAPVLAGKPGGGGSLSRVYRLLQPARGPLAPTHCRMGRALLVSAPDLRLPICSREMPAGWFRVSSPQVRQLLCCLPFLCLTVKIRQLSGLSVACPH